MDRETTEKAFDLAETYMGIATVIAAFAADEFERVTATEAFDKGWDSEDDNPLIFEQAGVSAIYNTTDNTIETHDQDGNPWQIELATGKTSRM